MTAAYFRVSELHLCVCRVDFYNIKRRTKGRLVVLRTDYVKAIWRQVKFMVYSLSFFATQITRKLNCQLYSVCWDVRYK